MKDIHVTRRIRSGDAAIPGLAPGGDSNSNGVDSSPTQEGTTQFSVDQNNRILYAGNLVSIPLHQEDW